MTQVPHLPRPSSSLYVGDLAPEVTEQALYDHFKHVGTIPSIRVLRDNLTGTSLGYAYVNFASQGEAEKALNELNYSRIRDRPCRIMYVNRDPTLRKTGVGNIIIRNLAKEIDYRGVTELCSKYGPILSCRILYDNATGESKGCAFVHFANDTGANDAVINLNGKIVRAENSPEEPGIQPLKVEHYQPQQILQQRALDTFTNVYIKHLKPDVSDEQLRNLFDSFGETISVRIMRHGDSESKGFAFCSYKDHTSAVKAIEDLHDKEHELSVQGRNMYVQRAMKRSERQRYVRQAIRERRLQYAQYTNLYVKNLDDAVTSEKLYSVFSPYGEIRSAKVMKDPITGVSKGFGFVSFINADDAKRAVKELANRLILSSKPLFVTYAQTKEERRRQLEERQQRSRYQQMDPTFSGMPGHTGATQHGYAPQSAMPQPMYPFGTPGMFPTGAHGPLHGPRGGHTQQPQQMLHQNRAPQQQQQHIMNSNVGVMPGRGGHPGMGINVGPPHGRGGLMSNVTQGGPMQSMPPMMKHQMGGIPRVGSGPLPSAAPQSLAMYSTSIQGPTAQSIPHAPVSVVGQPAVRAVQKSTSGIDPSMLAQMQPEQARNFLGEKLYHHISRSHPEQAAKITGMLLEMDNSEILNLLDSTDLLEMKVEEAVDVLRTHNK